MDSATPGRGLKPTRDLPANPHRFPALAAVIWFGNPTSITQKSPICRSPTLRWKPGKLPPPAQILSASPRLCVSALVGEHSPQCCGAENFVPASENHLEQGGYCILIWRRASVAFAFWF